MKNRTMNSYFKSSGIVLLFITAFLSCKTSNKLTSQEKLCRANTISLNKISPYYDGQWQGITVASDGACYFGSASHGLYHGGGFFKFDPSTKKLEVLAKDLTKLVGDDVSKNTPQGKVHSPIIEHNGNLFLATHLAAYWDEVLDKYAGSYFLSYNLANKKWTNYGITKPGFSTYSAIEVDKKRNKAYLMAVPFAPKDKAEGQHLYQIDLITREKKDLGKLDDGKAAFYFYLDDKGKVWITKWKGKGNLYCYDPEKDSIITYENAFPEPKLFPNGAPANDPKIKGASWTWAQPIDDGKRCLFTMGDYGGGDERLWIFDPQKDISSKAAFTPVAYIGNTFLSVALGGTRVYFIQRGDNTSSRHYDTEGKRDVPADKNGFHVNNLHLRSVALDKNDKNPFIDHGKLIDQDGRTPAYIGSLAADNKGNVFMSGGWLTKPGDESTLMFLFKDSKGKIYAPLEHPGQQSNNESGSSLSQYQKLKRGEFFSWVNVNKDLK
ncbi:MAG TPA: hypothetical protein VNI52_10170 [Sphingobacteriaceae bacterium]|nr:hypothetical protein [Sphingobacteriaceae bacterium]